MIAPQIQVTLGCNLACDYCFQGHGDPTIMEPAILEAVIDRCVAHNRREAPFLKEMEFLWHGGEPLLAGMTFFRRILEIQARTPEIRFDNRLQTNGLAMTDEMARFLVENHFSPGFSIDGPREVHDRHRLLKNGKTASFGKVMQGVANYRRYRPEGKLPVVATVTKETIAYGAPQFYRFFRDLKATIQLQPYDLTCYDLDRLPHALHENPYMPEPEAYGRFVVELFDLWFEDDPEVIDLCDLKTEIKFVLRPEVRLESIPDKKRCSPYRTIIDPLGRVFSCDMYVNNDHTALGNIARDSLDEMLEKKAALWERIKDHFRKGEAPYGCTTCKHGDLCAGACLTCMRYNNLVLGGHTLDDAPPFRGDDAFARSFPDCGDSYYCKAFRMIRDHVEARVREELGSGR